MRQKPAISLATVSQSAETISLSAPLSDGSRPNAGCVYPFILKATEILHPPRVSQATSLSGNPLQFGTSVALDGDVIIAGAPGSGAGRAYILELIRTATSLFLRMPLFNPAMAKRGTTSGTAWTSAATRRSSVRSVTMTKEQMRAQPTFLSAVPTEPGASNRSSRRAVRGRATTSASTPSPSKFNTIVVGATAWDFIGDDNAGAAYIFTRNGTGWTQQTELNGGSAYNFGIAVDISGDTIIIGARGADVESTPRAGAAYVYRLDCVPPVKAEIDPSSRTVCPGGSVTFSPSYSPCREVIRQPPSSGVGTVRSLPAPLTSSTRSMMLPPQPPASMMSSSSNACGAVRSNPVTLTVHSFSLNPAGAKLLRCR